MSSQVLLAEVCPYNQSLPLTVLPHVYFLQKDLLADVTFLLKNMEHDGPVAKSTLCCSRGPMFKSQQPHGGS